MDALLSSVNCFPKRHFNGLIDFNYRLKIDDGTKVFAFFAFYYKELNALLGKCMFSWFVSAFIEQKHVKQST